MALLIAGYWPVNYWLKNYWFDNYWGDYETPVTLKTQIASDLSIFFNIDEFAEIVSYIPKGGAAVDITAIVSRDNPFQEPYVRGEDTATCEIEVLASEVPTPQYGDTFTFGGETWEFDPVRGVIHKDDYTRLIGLEREM